MRSLWESMCSFRQAGHQQAAPSPGNGTTGGTSVHQQGPAAPSTMAQPKLAPHRVQVLMAPFQGNQESGRTASFGPR
jgi:hypothetical protein